MNLIAQAPGRVNLIGDHTDYASGFAMPIAINLQLQIKATPTSGTKITAFSHQLNELIEVDINDRRIEHSSQSQLERFIKAAVTVIKDVNASKLEITSDLPISSGLSSSAAFSVALLMSLGFKYNSKLELAKAAQKTEHLATGVPCGLLDQIAITMAEAGKALLINFSELSISSIPIPNEAVFLVIHSGIYRTLENQAYADRVKQADALAKLLGPLNEVGLEDLKSIKDPLLKRRAVHIITENERVKQASEALKQNDLSCFGQLLYQSHESLSKNYDVSTKEIDQIINYLKSIKEVIGARLTGAGFGGCIIAVLKRKLEKEQLKGMTYFYVIPSQGASLKNC